MAPPFPFGKHKGAPLNQLPLDYVSWLRKEVEFCDELADQMERFYGGEFRRKSRRRRQGSPPPPRGESSAVPCQNYKALRRKFAAKFHPDRPGGSVDGMRAVNVIFDDLESLK